MLLEVEIRSVNARNEIYDLRNFLQEEDSIHASIKEQQPVEGQMATGLIEPIIIGAIEGLVGHSVGEIYSKVLKPRIAKWMQSRKNPEQLEVLSTLKDDDTRVHFLEDSSGRSEIFENLRYAIDIDHTRAVLIGNSEFDGSFSPIPPVEGNLTDLRRLLTDKLHIGLPQENVVVALNKTNTEIEELLLQQSRIPGIETLIIYFAGHGHRTDVKKLYLVARNSKKIDDYLLGGVDFDFISNVVLRNATAKQKILILDACHSGIATQGSDDMIGRMDVKGSYVLASSPGDEVSYFEKNGRNTYFTGVLLNALKNGVDSANEMLALEDLYDYSKEHLSKKNFPHPIFKNELNIPPSNFFIARNPSFSFEKLKLRPDRMFREGRFEEALYEYRLLIQRYPEDAEIRRKSAECETNALFNRFVQDGDDLFYHMKDYRGAVEKYRKALQIKEDMLVQGKLNRCQDYLRTTPKVEVQKMSATTEIEKKKVKDVVVTPLKEERKKEEKQPVIAERKGEKKAIQISINERTLGIALAVIWAIAGGYFIFRTVDTLKGLEAFNKVGVPVGIVGLILAGIRWKKLIVTEMLLYALGFFLCVFPLISNYIGSREHSGKAMLLFLTYNIGYVVLLLKKLKEFKLADVFIASLGLAFFSFFFFYALLFVWYRPEYGSNETANTIGMIIGSIVGVLGIVWLRKRWLETRRQLD
jgi:hypothetical protein